MMKKLGRSGSIPPSRLGGVSELSSTCSEETAAPTGLRGESAAEAGGEGSAANPSAPSSSSRRSLEGSYSFSVPDSSFATLQVQRPSRGPHFGGFTAGRSMSAPDQGHRFIKGSPGAKDEAVLTLRNAKSLEGPLFYSLWSLAEKMDEMCHFFKRVDASVQQLASQARVGALPREAARAHVHCLQVQTGALLEACERFDEVVPSAESALDCLEPLVLEAYDYVHMWLTSRLGGMYFVHYPDLDSRQSASPRTPHQLYGK
eukprot:jgi/Mesen1/5726/ME000029S05035